MRKITSTIQKPEHKLKIISDNALVLFYLRNYKALKETNSFLFIQVNQAQTKYCIRNFKFINHVADCFNTSVNISNKNFMF